MGRKLCVICSEYEAEVPDRYKSGRQKKEVCARCHGKRLLGDLKRIKTLADHVYLCSEDEGGGYG